MSEKGKVWLGPKDKVKNVLPQLLKGRRPANKEEVNKSVATTVKATSKHINNALIDLIGEGKIGMFSSEDGRRLFKLL